MLKGFAIDVAHCKPCNLDFLYITGKINSVVNRNSDIYGCPRCPSCGSYRKTRNIGKFKVDTYHIEDKA